MHKSEDFITVFWYRTDCFWLFYGQPFHQPSKLLSCNCSYLSSISRQLKSALTVQTFIDQAKTILVEIQCLDRVAPLTTKQVQCICIRIHLISVPDNCHETVYAASHISFSCYQVNPGNSGNITQHRNCNADMVFLINSCVARLAISTLIP